MEIHWHSMRSLSDQKYHEVEARLHQLAAEHRDLVDIRIGCKRSGQSRHGIKRVRIAGQARGTSIVAVRDSESLHAATTEVLDAFERELRKLRSRRQRRDVRQRVREFRHRAGEQLEMAAAQ